MSAKLFLNLLVLGYRWWFDFEFVILKNCLNVLVQLLFLALLKFNPFPGQLSMQTRHLFDLLLLYDIFNQVQIFIFFLVNLNLQLLGLKANQSQFTLMRYEPKFKLLLLYFQWIILDLKWRKLAGLLVFILCRFFRFWRKRTLYNLRKRFLFKCRSFYFSDLEIM